MRMASGRTVEATANHPFLTVDGWCPLGELAVGDRLGVPRRVPAPTRPVPLPEERIVLLAQLVGARVERRPAAVAVHRDAGAEPAIRSAAAPARARRAGRTAVRLPAPFHLTCGAHNPIAAWLGRAGPVRAARPPEVRAGAGVRAAGRAARAVPAPAVGHRRRGELGRAAAAAADLLRLDQPAAGGRRVPAAAALRRARPDRAHPQGRLPGLLAPAHHRVRAPAGVHPVGRGARQPARWPAGSWTGACRRSPTAPTWTPSRTRCGGRCSRCWPPAG